MKNPGGPFSSIGAFFSSIGSAVWHGIESGCHWVSTHAALKAIGGALGVIALVAATLSFIPGVGQTEPGAGGRPARARSIAGLCSLFMLFDGKVTTARFSTTFSGANDPPVG